MPSQFAGKILPCCRVGILPSRARTSLYARVDHQALPFAIPKYDFSPFLCSNLIPCEPGNPASAWNDALRALCRSDSCPSRLCSRTASTQSGGALGQSDHCTCRIGVCQYSLMQKQRKTSAFLNRSRWFDLSQVESTANSAHR